MLNFLKNNFEEVVISIFVLIGGYVVSKIISKSQHKRQQLSDAIAKFRAPFEKSLSDLRAGKQAAGTIKGSMKTHVAAKDIFRSRLKIYKSRKVKSFGGFWDEYTCKKNNIDPKEYFRCYLAKTPEQEKVMNERLNVTFKNFWILLMNFSKPFIYFFLFSTFLEGNATVKKNNFKSMLLNDS